MAAPNWFNSFHFHGGCHRFMDNVSVSLIYLDVFCDINCGWMYEYEKTERERERGKSFQFKEDNIIKDIF